MWAIRSTAVLLLCLVITDIITHQSVQARFRGAQPKQIPSLAADGGLVNPNAGGQKEAHCIPLRNGVHTMRAQQQSCLLQAQLYSGRMPMYQREFAEQRGGCCPGGCANGCKSRQRPKRLLLTRNYISLQGRRTRLSSRTCRCVHRTVCMEYQQAGNA